MSRKSSPVVRVTGHGDRRWPVVALLIAVVLLPSATVLWLTNAAVRNERAAIEQRLVTAYERQLDLAATQVNRHWRQVSQQCELLSRELSGAELFRACVTADFCDSALILGPQGDLQYPAIRRPDPAAASRLERFNEVAWRAASRLEFVQRNVRVAADAYAAIANVEPNPNAEALAWMAHARCLEKDGQRDRAISVLTKQLSVAELTDAVDLAGRSIWLDAQIRAMQLMDEASLSERLEERRSIVRTALQDYSRPIPSSQRLFGMNECLALGDDEGVFPTLSAELLAARQAEQYAARDSFWAAAGDPCCVRLQGIDIVLLFNQDGLTRRNQDLLASWQTEDTRVQVTQSKDIDAVAAIDLDALPGHRLALTLSNPNLWQESARHQTSLYTFAGLITIAIVSLVAVTLAVFMHRQLRLAQMKNDLAAVVTHELRTPLASVRMLVDTLLEEDSIDPQRRVEYLQLISQENQRLSRLIENFLRFSRLQRGRERFAFQMIGASELSRRAIAAAGQRLQSQEEADFTAELPDEDLTVRADSDAMVTVLTNLLDNAIKFTRDPKRIAFNVHRDGDRVNFCVSDNGIGMTAAQSRRVFDKFYQADTRLSRPQDGCGLGLSLVRWIVHAHGGTVDVDSTVDRGSTFTVRMPLAKQEAIS